MNSKINPAHLKLASVIGSTSVKPTDESTKPFRIVLRFLGAGMATPYVTHLQTLDDGGLHNGEYCSDMLEGYESLKRRAAKYGLKVNDANGKRIPLSKLNATL